MTFAFATQDKEMSDLEEDFVDALVTQIQDSAEPEKPGEQKPKKKKRPYDPNDEERCHKKRRYKSQPVDRSDHFYQLTIPAMTIDDFRVHFRMSRSCMQSITTRIGNRCRIFNLEKKILYTVWMLATRDSFGVVADRFCLSKGSAHLSFCEILDSLIVLFKEYVSWPSEFELSHIEQGFKPIKGEYVPGIVGAIHSCHVLMKKPSRYSIYCNPKQTHSIIVQGVCDHQKVFTDVYVGAPGCLNAERVFNNSPLSKLIKTLIPEEYHIVGNAAFPQKQNLIVPFVDFGMLSDREAHFNECVESANSKIVDAFRLLMARFRRLAFLDTGNPEMANKIAVACVILHNHILMTDLDDDQQMILQEWPEMFLNTGPEGYYASDDDPEAIAKRNNLLALMEFI